MHPNSAKTHCPQNHDYATHARIYDGRRYCRACERLRSSSRPPRPRGERQPRRVAPLGERIAARLRRAENGCLEWQGCLNRKGYGVISRADGGTRVVHRAVWELANGPVPDGMLVCHTCDNPPCCDLDHLFLGTPADNTQDMVSKGRYRCGPNWRIA